MKSALITGSSSGFGLLTAVALAGLGWQVFATMRDPAKGEALAGAARAAGVADSVRILEMDVTRRSSIDAALACALESTGGTLDVLLNNAGFTSIGFFEDMSDENCRAVIETNFFGALDVTRAVIPVMRKMRSGRIAFVSSNAVNAPHPTMTMYAASKWALEGFAEALAMELVPFGVDVVVLQPGNHRTPFGSHVQAIRPADSPYAPIWDALTPGLTELAAIGADPATAVPAFLDSLVAPRPPFLQPIGTDVKLFSWLKRCATYEVRAAAVRHFVRFPGHKRRNSPLADS